MLLVCFLVSSNSVVVSGILSYEFCRCSESEYSKTEDFILDLYWSSFRGDWPSANM